MTREEREENFRNDTEIALLGCADWVRDNAKDLSKVIKGGCTNWDIDFSWETINGTTCVVPHIDIRISKLGKIVRNGEILM